MTIVMNRVRPAGRHRLGRPGLIPVTALTTVLRRGFIRAWFRPGRHRSPAAQVVSNHPGRVHLPAAA